jgi:hypothetical protein
MCLGFLRFNNLERRGVVIVPILYVAAACTRRATSALFKNGLRPIATAPALPSYGWVD